MPSATGPNASAHVPAWKRLGLKLKSAQEPEQPAGDAIIEPDTSKRKRLATTTDNAPIKKSKRSADLSVQVGSEVAPVTPQLTRKKSVTFTPETKAEDGDSIKQLFNSWVAEQKSADPSFQFKNSSPAFKTPDTPRVEEDVDPNLDEKERRVKRVKKPKAEKAEKSKQPKKPAKITKPAAHFSRPFLQYLKEYCESRSTWKFNKNHQNHLLRHAFDADVVPSDHALYLFEYVRGLQGGVRTRLRDTALGIKVKDQEDGIAGFPSTMADTEKRQRDYDVAMKEYVATMTAAQTPASMGYEEGVELGLSDKAMAGRVAKRMRAERILAELASSPGKDENGAVLVSHEDKSKRLRLDDGSVLKVARKRKQRTITDVDSSSSESESDDESEDDEVEGAEGAADTSSSSSSSSSESESGEGDSEGDSEDGSEEDGSEESTLARRPTFSIPPTSGHQITSHSSQPNKTTICTSHNPMLGHA
ncbi:uncharacterized protein LY89DRAFT_697808 [Mollisia scopiformis]|uniref:WKF domain-containing protein n=1 Tax=Mollisia scopiformis TaxID=149040 RepID=A0A194X6C3_MOLSC|nr:uncharacterized protein LY89DRAFT_697808 [Mollisia scopiformis]KUJ15731.1 hypothetical protein LY89DRAFT_697808 [Mollisia scopiformis]